MVLFLLALLVLSGAGLELSSGGPGGAGGFGSAFRASVPSGGWAPPGAGGWSSPGAGGWSLPAAGGGAAGAVGGSLSVAQRGSSRADGSPWLARDGSSGSAWSLSVARGRLLASGGVFAGADRGAVPRRAGGDFGSPVDGGRVVRRFDPPPQPWLAGHRGVDLAAPPGAVVRAAGAGTIVFAGRVAGRGVVSVAHLGGLRTTYEPVVAGDWQPGDAVATGEVLGRLAPGHGGCAEAACLHWGLRRGGDYLDPLALLGLGRVRLLPCC